MSTPRPRNGYAANPAKQQWRHVAFQFSDRTAFARRKGDRVVACLESSEGCEVRHAIACGYRPDQIHAFNLSAAVLASMTRTLDRAGVPRVHTHARSIAEVSAVLPGGVDLLSLDFTGPLTEARQIEINRAAAALRPGAVAMINILAAREQGRYAEGPRAAGREEMMFYERAHHRTRTMSGKELAQGDMVRLVDVVVSLTTAHIDASGGTGCRWRPIAYRFGRYFSGPLPYLWTAIQVAPCNGNAFRERLLALQKNQRHLPAEPFIETLSREFGWRIPFLCVCELTDYQAAMPRLMEMEAERRARREAIDRDVAELRRHAAELGLRFGNP